MFHIQGIRKHRLPAGVLSECQRDIPFDIQPLGVVGQRDKISFQSFDSLSQLCQIRAGIMFADRDRAER